MTWFIMIALLAIWAYIFKWPSYPDKPKEKLVSFWKNILATLIHASATIFIKFSELSRKNKYFFLHRANVFTKIGNLLTGPYWEKQILEEERINPGEPNFTNEPSEESGKK